MRDEFSGIDRIGKLSSGLLEWASTGGRLFPWRGDNFNEYQLVIVEVLLQRTRAETVERFIPKFFEKYPGWEDIANAYSDDLELDLRPVGLSERRSKTMILLAKAVLCNDGKMPISRLEIDKLPGVGQYIGNAIELLILGRPLPLLDASMARLIERYIHPRKLADIRYDPFLQSAALALVQHEKSKEISWAALDFAATVCKSSRPRCDDCPFSGSCNYNLSGES